MKWLRGEGWRDPLGAALLLASLLTLAILWHAIAPTSGLVLTHWHPATAAR